MEEARASTPHVTVHVLYATCYRTSDHTHCFSVGGRQDDTFSLPSRLTTRELFEYLRHNSTFTWPHGDKVLNTREMETAAVEPKYFFEINAERVANIDDGTTLEQHYEARAKKHHLELRVAWGVYDGELIREIERAHQRLCTLHIERRKFFMDALNDDRDLTSDELVELFCFPFASFCPHTQTDERSRWEYDITEGFDRLLCAWATTPARPQRLRQLCAALVDGVERIDSVHAMGLGGNGWQVILHHCKPYKDADARTSSNYFYALWAGLWDNVIPASTQLTLLCAVYEHWKRADGIDCLAAELSLWTKWAQIRVANETRDKVVTLLCIRKFRRSDLDVLPAVIVQLIARTIWNMQPVVNPQQLKTPPRFRFFD